MTRPLTRDEIEAAYRAACRLEVRTLKPGNVHIFADGHRMTVADFDTSAEVSAPHISNNTLPVGTRIRRAVEATSPPSLKTPTSASCSCACPSLSLPKSRDLRRWKKNSKAS